MNKIKLCFCILLACLVGRQTLAQTSRHKPVNKNELRLLVKTIADSLVYYYVDVEEGRKTADFLKEQLKKGSYDSLQDPDQLAKRLTKDLRQVYGDVHLYVAHRPESSSNPQSTASPLEADYGRKSNFGQQEIKFLEDNIAYLKISHFSHWDHAIQARQKITKVMALVGDSDALIMDLRDNPGGYPWIAGHQLSYLFKAEPVHLADYYTRYNDSQYGIYTEAFVPGNRYPDLPVFVIVNNNSGSAAEEVAFWLQNKKRATIIGQTTVGAGYGAAPFRLNERFIIQISRETEVDPISRKGFQLTGVVPDVVVASDSAYTVALKLAKAAASSYYQKKYANRTTLDSLRNLLQRPEKILTKKEIQTAVTNCVNWYECSMSAINALGYEYLDQPKKTLALFEINTKIYPFVANVFDSYADGLVGAKQYPEALLNYNKAIQLAELKQRSNLNQLRENKAAFLKTYGDKLEE